VLTGFPPKVLCLKLTQGPQASGPWRNLSTSCPVPKQLLPLAVDVSVSQKYPLSERGWHEVSLGLGSSDQSKTAFSPALNFPTL
jgi:hypothetical protein